MTVRTALAAAGITVAAVLAGPALADGPGHFSVGAGAFDFTDQDDESAVGGLQYYSGHRVLESQLGSRFRGIGPMLGLTVNTDGGVFGYGGLYADVRITEQIVLLPSAGLGGYSEGDSKDLGGTFQFHVGTGLFYEFREDQTLPAGSRVGITFQHISNADIHDRNPGANSIMLSYSIPLPSGF